MATDKVKVVKIETGEAQTSVKELRSQLKQLKDTMLSVEEGTKEYNDALQQAANIQHALKEQMEEVNASAMDFGQIAGIACVIAIRLSIFCNDLITVSFSTPNKFIVACAA